MFGSVVVEAFEPGTIVVEDEGADEVVSFLVCGEAVFTGVASASGVCGDGVAETPVEAFDHAVGLRVIGPGELVADAACSADAVEGVAAGAVCTLSLWVAEAVCELGAVVGKHGMDGISEGIEKALEGLGDGHAAAIGEDVDVDEAGGPFDDDEDIGGPALEAGEVLEVGVDEAERLGREALRGACRGGRRSGYAMTVPQAVQSRARDVGTQAAMQHLERIVERQAEPGAQFERDLLLLERQAGRQPMRPRGGDCQDFRVWAGG